MEPLRAITWILLFISLTQGTISEGKEPQLIAREVLFGNPEKIRPRISPDGKHLAYGAPDSNNVLQVWVRTIGQQDDRVLTADKKRGIRSYFWAQNNHTLLYLQDADGDENFHVYGAEVDGEKNVRDYTPWQGVRAALVKLSPKAPNTILVSMNARDRRLKDVYRVDLATGAVAIDTKNPGDFDEFTADDNLQVHAATVYLPDGGSEIRWRANANANWKSIFRVGPEEKETGVWDLSADNREVFLTSSVGSNTARLVAHPTAGGVEKVIAQDESVDIQDAIIHPTRHVVQAARFDKGRLEWAIIDPTIRADFEAIRKLSDGDIELVDRDLADRTWIVSFSRDLGSVKYYAYDRSSQGATFLFVERPQIEALPLAPMKPVAIRARDGLTLNGYLTQPLGSGPKGPMVLLVHGGPWSRDLWGFNPTVQWLANRGYAVLQVNYRGSTGYGKKHLHAADHQFGRAMHDDLIDAVNWAIEQGIADPKRIAIMGGSYGGYAALAGAAFTPEVFHCAVDVVGPSNLITLINSFPPYWGVLLGFWYQRAGDPRKPEEKTMLEKASPLFSASRIKIPLLIGQGANDPRVKQAESEQIVSAIEKNHGRVIYVVYPDEGHGFLRPENRIDFNARVERFLSENIGGRFEPIQGDRYSGSSAVVREVGQTSAPGAALRTH